MMITYTMITDDDDIRVYEIVGDTGATGRVTVSKTDYASVYEGETIMSFPPAWLQSNCEEMTRRGLNRKQFSYGRG